MLTSERAQAGLIASHQRQFMAVGWAESDREKECHSTNIRNNKCVYVLYIIFPSSSSFVVVTCAQEGNFLSPVHWIYTHLRRPITATQQQQATLIYGQGHWRNYLPEIVRDLREEYEFSLVLLLQHTSRLSSSSSFTGIPPRPVVRFICYALLTSLSPVYC